MADLFLMLVLAPRYDPMIISYYQTPGLEHFWHVFCVQHKEITLVDGRKCQRSLFETLAVPVMSAWLSSSCCTQKTA